MDEVQGHILWRRWCEIAYLCPIECSIQRPEQHGWTKGELTCERGTGGIRFFHPAFSEDGLFLPGMWGRLRPQDWGVWITLE